MSTESVPDKLPWHKRYEILGLIYFFTMMAGMAAILWYILR